MWHLFPNNNAMMFIEVRLDQWTNAIEEIEFDSSASFLRRLTSQEVLHSEIHLPIGK